MPHSVTAQEKMAAQRMAHYLLLFMMAPYSANAAETVYNEVVRQVLLKAAGQAADSKLIADQAAAGIKAAWAKGAQANDQTSTVMYAVSDGMTSAQLAELLYAKSGAKDTLFHKTQSTIKAQLAAGRNNEQVTDGVESSLKTLATQLAGSMSECGRTGGKCSCCYRSRECKGYNCTAD